HPWLRPVAAARHRGPLAGPGAGLADHRPGAGPGRRTRRPGPPDQRPGRRVDAVQRPGCPPCGADRPLHDPALRHPPLGPPPPAPAPPPGPRRDPRRAAAARLADRPPLRDRLADWTLREAEILGLTGLGALSTPARALLAADSSRTTGTGTADSGSGGGGATA